jgi:hypothetical protein
VCRRAHSQLGTLARQLRDIFTAAAKHRITARQYFAQAGALTARSAEIAQSAVDQLHGLGVPADPVVQGYVATAASQARLLATQADAIRRGDRSAIARINGRLVALGRRTMQLARRYGFHVCGGTGR